MNLCSHQVSNCPVYPHAFGGEVVGRRWRSHATTGTHSASGQYPHLENSFLRRTGSQGKKCLTLWRWRTTSFSGVSQRSRTTQRFRGPTEASALTSCVTSTPLLTCHLTHRWWSESEDVHSLAAAACICIELHSSNYPDLAPFQFPDRRQLARSLTDLLTTHAAILGRRQLHNVRLRLCNEVVPEEYRILASVNYELETCTPADWVCLFEGRFSLSVQHLQQRFPQWTGSLLSLLARVPSGVLASAALCLASDYVRDRPLSLESTPCRIGSSAWFLSCVVWVSFLLSGAR